MANRLSHSAISRYQMCGKSYYYHYVEKLRPTSTSAALLFGDAIDKAVNQILLPKEDSPTAEEIFQNAFTTGWINRQPTFIPTEIRLAYADKDFDADLLVGKELLYTNQTLEDFKPLREKKKEVGYDKLTDDERSRYNVLNWNCLLQKGLLVIRDYRRLVMPKIKKVHFVQRQIDLTNQDGDSIIGYVDLCADIEGQGTVILDNKTSSMRYEADAVLTSPQLALYIHALGEEFNTRKAGFIVMYKDIKKNKTKVCSVCGYDGSGARHKTCSNEIDGKRCGGEWTEKIAPEVDFDLIISTMPAITEEIVLENFDEINRGLGAKLYPRNFSSCKNWYGQNCPYIDLCFKNKKTGLVEET